MSSNWLNPADFHDLHFPTHIHSNQPSRTQSITSPVSQWGCMGLMALANTLVCNSLCYSLPILGFCHTTKKHLRRKVARWFSVTLSDRTIYVLSVDMMCDNYRDHLQSNTWFFLHKNSKTFSKLFHRKGYVV